MGVLIGLDHNILISSNNSIRLFVETKNLEYSPRFQEKYLNRARSFI